MPALFSLSQHLALEGIQRRLQDNEWLLTFLDDIYVVCHADGVSGVLTMLQEELFHRFAIRFWNQSGVEPSGTAALTATGRISDPDAMLWCVDQALHTSEQGPRILGITTFYGASTTRILISVWLDCALLWISRRWVCATDV